MESAELRTIRQTINGVKLAELSSEGESLELEVQFQLAYADAISKLWNDESVDSASAEVLSSWIWRHLVATPDVPNLTESNGLEDGGSDSLITGRIKSLMLCTLSINSTERRNSCQTWCKSYVLEKLKSANLNLIERAVMDAYATITDFDEYRDIMVVRLLQLVPTMVLDSLS